MLIGSTNANGNAAMWTADRRLYLDKGGKVVEEGDLNQNELLVPAGGVLPMARAEELGLLEQRPAAKTRAEAVPGTKMLKPADDPAAVPAAPAATTPAPRADEKPEKVGK